MDSLSFKLDVFEGPLDLLINLIGKKKIEIWDINISDILEQYLEYLNLLEEMNMEICAEFTVMASNLIYIKSRMLLPTLADDEKDPRENLLHSLQQYQLAKEGAKLLREKYEDSKTSFTKEGILIPAAEAEPNDGEFNSNVISLAYERVLVKSKRRLPPPINSFSGIVGREVSNVSDKIASIFKNLKQYGMLKVDHLFKKSKSRSDIVAIFLALLEMSKENKIQISSINNDDRLDECVVEMKNQEAL